MDNAKKCHDEIVDVLAKYNLSLSESVGILSFIIHIINVAGEREITDEIRGKFPRI